MKVYVAVDMEGLTGVVHSSQTVAAGNERHYLEAREWMVAEANAAVKGAADAGADEIVVNDVHWPMRNLLPDRLDPGCALVRGFNKPWFTLEGLDASCKVMLCIGYHGTASMSQAVLGHTYLSKEIVAVRALSSPADELMELGVEALVAGELGVPIGLVTGDRATTEAARRILGPVETVAVKRGLDRYAATCLGLDEARGLIADAARRAVKGVAELRAYRLPGPAGLEVEFSNASHATRSTYVPGVRLASPRAVAIQAATWREVYRLLVLVVQLAAQNIDPYY